MKSSTTRERLTAALARIDDPIGEGARTRLPSIATARAPRPRPPNALPTTPMVAPTIAEMTSPDVFARKNAPLLRNTSTANFFDLCAISLPLPRAGGLPTGLAVRRATATTASSSASRRRSSDLFAG